MFKRFVALTLALLLLAGLGLAEETPLTGTAPQYQNQLDKLMQQMRLSSVRGAFRLTVEGDSDLALALQPLTGAMIQFRLQNANLAEGETRSEIILYAEKEGVRTADTRLWSDGENLYAASDMLIDTILRYPWKGDFISSIMSLDQSNPNYLTAVAKALIHGLDWEKDAAALRTHAENWLMKYAGSPQRVTEGDFSGLRFTYEIPERDLKTEIKALLRVALSDNKIYNRVSFYLTDAQRRTAFSDANLAYEDWMIDSFPLGGALRIVRDVNTMGEQQRLRVVYPLGENAALTWEQNGQTDSCTLEMGGAVYGFTLRQTKALKDSQAWDGSCTYPRDGKQLRANFTLSRDFSEMTDTEYVNHEIPTWTLEVTPAQDSQVSFEPISMILKAHYYSNYAIRSNTTLEVGMVLTQGTTRLNLRGKLNTRDRLVIEDMDVAGARDVAAMTPAERQEIYMDFLTNALVTLSFLGETGGESAAESAGSAEAPMESEETLPGLMPVDADGLDESEEDAL